MCPTFYNSSLFNGFLQDAIESENRKFWGCLYNKAVAYKAWHLFEMSGAGKSDTAASISEISGGRQVASMSEGGISISFDSAAPGGTMSDSNLNSTVPGHLYLSLIKSRPTMGVNTAGTRLRGGFC
ncbi:MAG: DUF4054 domain-containing protein [Treponema sp.]|nr:DUF4054 domain-containing protein [Treponema sp.]